MSDPPFRESRHRNTGGQSFSSPVTPFALPRNPVQGAEIGLVVGPTRGGAVVLPDACPHCHGRKYVIYESGELARARVCDCNGPCSTCRGKGFLLKVDDSGYQFHTPCECQKQRHRVELFNRALIPSHFAEKDLSNFECGEQTHHILEYVKAMARGYPAEKNGLLLVGAPGVGKTHLVVGILKVLTLEKSIPCLFKDFFLLLSEVKTAYETGRFETEVLRPLAEIEVLVVDELGKGRSNSDWEQSLLDEIVCKRYNQMKTTLLTTNFPLEPSRERMADASRPVYGSSTRRTGLGNLTSSALTPTLEERVGERIFSRLRQMSTLLRVESADYRRTHSVGGGSRSRR